MKNVTTAYRNLPGMMLGLAIAIAVALAPVTACAQETKEKETKEKETKTKEANPETSEDKTAEEELFPVPEEASAMELFAFFQKVKRTPPKDRSKGREHLKLQVEAIVAGVDKIMTSKPEIALEKRAITEKLGALKALGRYYRKESRQQTADFMKQLEADERPEIVALLQQQKMMDKLTAIRSMPVDERAAAI